MRMNLVRRLVLAGGALVLLQGTMALAAVDMYLQIDEIKGETADGAMHVTSVTHPQAAAPMGMASGKRMHSPITITKSMDMSSPKLMQAMTGKKPLGTVTITFKGAGAGKAVQTVKLTNAMITNIRESGTTETITLDYQAEEVTWTDGGKTSTDDWEVPK